jgi:hypothetical protein
MHNGIKVYAGSYYGRPLSKMLHRTKGVHEPQEEYAFQEVLKQIAPKGIMLEMGAYWSFYSMWFNKMISDAYNIMIEPDKFNLEQGKRNFKLNKMKGVFVQGFIGNKYSNDSVEIFSVDYLFSKFKIESLQILHSDIQGYELEMIDGASESLKKDLIDFIFISTHSNELHRLCLEKLISFGQKILCEANLDESYGHDGLIVSCSSRIDFPIIDISKRTLPM